MDGWTVAFILYLIPLLTGIVRSKMDPGYTIPSLILWPPMMLGGAIILWFHLRKK